MATHKNLTSAIILKLIERHRCDINKYGAKKVGLFGSFLKKRQRRGSDIDLLVTFDEPTFDNYIELKFFLERLFHKKVDLVIEDTLKPALRYVKEEAVYAKGI